ncbi:hypothetical protein B296_00001275 [Ensete ventricosum]|uniref:Uncharacterized protein n=1 Tax=Ensete ventricosum TaxID=4639 RepID=A0A427AVT7_ENSVE|nr:hypothetical protein B296_00001275 [Ensete ventricosum]
MDMPQKNYSLGQIIRYGLKWILTLLLMEAMTHFFYYNAFAVRTKIPFCFVWFLLANYYYMLIIYACYQVRSAFGMCIQRELSAIAGAVTISCLMVCFIFI